MLPVGDKFKGLLILCYRFGWTYWKLTQSQIDEKLWTLRDFKPPTHILSRFLAVYVCLKIYMLTYVLGIQ